jgi:hypothetical protein
MRTWIMCVIGAFALWATTALAQGTPPSEGTQGNTSTNQQAGHHAGMRQPGTGEPTGSTQQNTWQKGQKSLKGCVESENGQYMLETRKGKEITLSGTDVAAHVGHEVEVQGMWQKGGESGMSQSSTAEKSGSQKTFEVSNVKMISDSCHESGMKGHSKGMGMGSGTGTGTGTGATPPQ